MLNYVNFYRFGIYITKGPQAKNMVQYYTVQTRYIGSEHNEQEFYV